MTEMLKDKKFYGLVFGYFIGLAGLIISVHTFLDSNYIMSCIIGFILSGFILVGIAIFLTEDEKQTEVTEYNFEESKTLLED